MVLRVGHEPDRAKRIRQRQGNTIRQVRQMRGMSIAEFADNVGVSPGAVSHWETGKITPRQHHQVRIAQVLDTPWGVLFSLDGEVG
jgi:transcriptional regulator with XRE-family HTH domain